MKNVYRVVRSIMLFYFLASLFAQILVFPNGNTLQGIFLPALIFGVLVAALPTILGFFKINDNNGALLLGGLVVNFIFYFLGYYVANMFDIVAGKIVFFVDPLTMTIDDKTLGLIMISLVSSALSVFLEALSNKR